MVGSWKASVYDMHHVVVSVKSRRVPGAMSDEELFSSCNESSNENDTENEDHEDVLTQEERKQLEIALKMDSPDIVDDDLADGFVGHRHSCYEQREIPIEDVSSSSNGESKQDKKRWFDWAKGGQISNHKQEGKNNALPRSSLSVDEKVSDLLRDSESSVPGRHSMEISIRLEDLRWGRDKDRDTRKSSSTLENGQRRKDSEYKKGLRPVLCLSPNFPLQTEEFLPLLDIIAKKVKAILRLRDLLTTKLPSGTFPVKVAIPVVPTIRVLVTFTKFEELQPSEEFLTPPSSPKRGKSPVP